MRKLAFVFNSSVHTSTGYTPYELFFGRKVRIPVIILFSAALRNKSEVFSISEFKIKFSGMYELTNEAMNTRQIKALTYHYGKVCNNVSKENTVNKLYACLPRNKRDKLSLKWTGHVRIIKENIQLI